MVLINKTQLCYINTKDLWQWIEENNLLTQDFTAEKEKWNKGINQEPNFFSDTELLLIYQDIILLKTLTDNQTSFLAKTYQLANQTICQKIFQGNKKDVILISERQWKLRKQENDEKAIILFKDKESIEKSLTSWLKEIDAQ